MGQVQQITMLLLDSTDVHMSKSCTWKNANGKLRRKYWHSFTCTHPSLIHPPRYYILTPLQFIFFHFHLPSKLSSYLLIDKVPRFVIRSWISFSLLSWELQNLFTCHVNWATDYLVCMDSVYFKAMSASKAHFMGDYKVRSTHPSSFVYSVSFSVRHIFLPTSAEK